MTLTEFITAQLDEDEATARDAYYDGQMWVPEEEAVVAADRDLDPVLVLDRKRDAQHAANWSPARVLAQVAAMRAIVEGCERSRRHDDYTWVAEQVLRHLAAAWQSHDGYDPAWAPDTQT